MSKKSKRRGYRITVKANGKLRQILSITENSNTIGIVTIFAMPAEYFRENLKDTSVAVNDMKYSIHPNLKSNDTNNIHGVVKRTGVEDVDYTSQTKALKINNCFAPVFARASPDLRHKQYDVRPGGENKTWLNIGDYNPDWTTLLYCLLLSPPGTSDTIDKSGKKFTVTSMSLPNFDLTILCSALPDFKSASMGPIMTYNAMEGVAVDTVEDFYQRFVVDEAILRLTEMHSRGVR